jgi:hypothetical protein
MNKLYKFMTSTPDTDKWSRQEQNVNYYSSCGSFNFHYHGGAEEETFTIKMPLISLIGEDAKGHGIAVLSINSFFNGGVILKEECKSFQIINEWTYITIKKGRLLSIIVSSLDGRAGYTELETNDATKISISSMGFAIAYSEIQIMRLKKRIAYLKRAGI